MGKYLPLDDEEKQAALELVKNPWPWRRVSPYNNPCMHDVWEDGYLRGWAEAKKQYTEDK